MQIGRRPKFTLDSRSSKQTSRKVIAIAMRPLLVVYDALSLYAPARNQRYDINSKERKGFAYIGEVSGVRGRYEWEEDERNDSLGGECKKAK